MRDHKIIRRSAAKLPFQIGIPFLRFMNVNRIHDRNLFIQNNIGVIGNTVRNRILALKQIDFLIIRADIFYRI